MSDSKQTKTPLIMIIAGDSATQQTLAQLLSNDGYRVTSKEANMAVFGEILEETPDLVMVDGDISGFDTYSLCTRLREQEETNALPILLIVGSQNRNTIQKCFTVGANDYISRPIHWLTLRHRVHNLLLASQAKQQVYYDTGIEQQISERYTAIFDSVEGIVWEADASTFATTFVNEGAVNLLGYPVEQWLTEKDFWPIIFTQKTAIGRLSCAAAPLSRCGRLNLSIA